MTQPLNALPGLVGRARRRPIVLDKTQTKATTHQVVISPPNFQSAKIRIKGAPYSSYVSNAFSQKAIEEMMRKQLEGSRAKKGEKRQPKNFDAVYRGGLHIAQQRKGDKGGWYGIPASGIRNALVSACSISGFFMTKGKKCLFVEAEGFDTVTGQPLVRLYGEPTRRDLPVTLASGTTDILPRPMFDEWYATPIITWDADMFSANDVLNLMARAGRQIGIGAGRPDSKNSTGMGWGTFIVES